MSTSAEVSTVRDRPAPGQRQTTLTVRRLSVRLGNRRVLREIDLEATSGHITAVVGPNGAGKSTLLRALLGLVPYAGSISLRELGGGTDEVRELPLRDRAQRIAYVPQRSELNAALSVRQVVEAGRFAATTHGQLDPNPGLVERALRETDLTDQRDRAFTELSGGEQRRTLIARALATGARTLLLDEPTASLDLAHALELFELLQRLSHDGYLVVAALHRLSDVLEHTRHVAVLSRGRLVAAGETATTLSPQLLRESFGLLLERHAAPRFRRL